MPQYKVLDTVYVPFQPSGSLVEMDLSVATALLNKTEASLELNWREAGQVEEYETKNELVDLVYGFVGQGIVKDSEPAFLGLELKDGLLKINVLDTPQGKLLESLQDRCVDMRFTVSVNLGEDPKVPMSFQSFHITDVKGGVKEPVKEEVKSDIIALPGKDFDVDNPVGI